MVRVFIKNDVDYDGWIFISILFRNYNEMLMYNLMLLKNDISGIFLNSYSYL